MLRLRFETDIDKTEELLEVYLANLSDGYEALVSKPNYSRCSRIYGTSEIIVRIIAETKPVMQYAIARTISIGLKSI